MMMMMIIIISGLCQLSTGPHCQRGTGALGPCGLGTGGACVHMFPFGSRTPTLFPALGPSSTGTSRHSWTPCIPTSALSCWATPQKRPVAGGRWVSSISPTAACSGEPGWRPLSGVAPSSLDLGQPLIVAVGTTRTLRVGKQLGTREAKTTRGPFVSGAPGVRLAQAMSCEGGTGQGKGPLSRPEREQQNERLETVLSCGFQGKHNVWENNPDL